MALPRFEKDIANISKLPDQPNDVGGLTAAEFKAEFDKAGESIQEYINNDLIPQIESDIEAAALGVGGGGAITTDKITAGAVTATKIANGAVITEKIADKAVSEGKLSDSAVTTTKVADGAVNTAKVADKAITRNKLADESVSSDKLFPGAVIQNKIAAGAVSLDKLAKNARSLVFENLTVPDYWWEEDGRFSIYPYAAKVNMPDSGIAESYVPDITFDENDESLAPIATTFDGGFYIYAASPPETLVRILSAKFTPGLAEAFANEVFGSIAVSYASGKELSCTDGTMTMKAKTTSGRWTFAVPYAGTWTVSDGEYEQSVSITTQGQNVHVVLGRTWGGVLYDAGDEWPEITGGWEQNPQNTHINAALSGNVVFNAGNIYINAPASKAAGINTKNKVDITGYSVLYFDVTVETQNNDSYGLVASIPTDISYDAVAKTNSTSTGRMTLSVDLSDVTDGEYYVVIGATAGTVAQNRTVHKVWLE